MGKRPMVRRKPIEETEQVKGLELPIASDSAIQAIQPVTSAPLVADGRARRVVEPEQPQWPFCLLREKAGVSKHVHAAVMVANGIKPGAAATVDQYKRMVADWLGSTG